MISAYFLSPIFKTWFNWHQKPFWLVNFSVPTEVWNFKTGTSRTISSLNNHKYWNPVLFLVDPDFCTWKLIRYNSYCIRSTIFKSLWIKTFIANKLLVLISRHHNVPGTIMCLLQGSNCLSQTVRQRCANNIEEYRCWLLLPWLSEWTVSHAPFHTWLTSTNDPDVT